MHYNTKFTKPYFPLLLVLSFFVINACGEEDEPGPVDESIMVNITNNTNAGGCGEMNGSLTATATSDNSDSFTFSVDGNNFQSSGSFNNLAPGEYTVTARDEDGNIGTSDPVRVLSGVSFAATIQPIINTNCAISGCHDGSRGDTPDWSDKSNVIANASRIKSQTSAKTMPPSSSDRSLTDEQIDLIACWADDGAPDN